MKILTKEQIKIIYTSAAALVFLLIFWILVYAPVARKFSGIKAQLASADAQIAQITGVIGGKNLIEATEYLSSELNKVSVKFPARPQVVMDKLTEAAKKRRLVVKGINFKDIHLLDRKISGRSLDEVIISMDLSGEFRQLGEFLSTLRNYQPVLVKVKQLSIIGKGEGNVNLDIALELDAYLSY